MKCGDDHNIDVQCSPTALDTTKTGESINCSLFKYSFIYLFLVKWCFKEKGMMNAQT